MWRVFVVAVVLAVAGCGGPSEEGPDRPGVRSTELSAAPAGVARVGDEVWVALPSADAVRGEAGAMLRVPGEPSFLLRVEGQVWVSTTGGLRLLDASGSSVGAIRLPGASPGGMALAGDLVWVADGARDRVLGIDVSSHAVVRRVKVGAQPRRVAAADGLVAVSGGDGVTVFSAGDPSPRAVPVPGCAEAGGVAVAAGLVWVACSASGEVVAVDPSSGEVRIRVPLPGVDAVAVLGGLVVAGGNGPTLVGIDAASRRTGSPVEVAKTGSAVGLAFLEDEVVVADALARRLHTVPLDLLLP